MVLNYLRPATPGGRFPLYYYATKLRKNSETTKYFFNKFVEKYVNATKPVRTPPHERNSAVYLEVSEKDIIFATVNLKDSIMTDTELQQINALFNEQLQLQIEGKLKDGHVYQLGMPSDVLINAGVPNNPIEMASRRLGDKSLQANHPFGLEELTDLVLFIQDPMAVFRSATHYGSYVLFTELLHEGKNYVLAIETNRVQGKMKVNSVRSVHYKDNPMNIINWINENLADYIRPDFKEKWFAAIKNELLSKPQSNSVDVRKQLISAAKIMEKLISSKKT